MESLLLLNSKMLFVLCGSACWSTDATQTSKGFKNFFVIIVDNCDIHRVFHLIALKSYCLSHWELSPALSKEIPWRTEIRNTTWVLG